MSDERISKEELKAMLSVQEKSTQQLEKIATALAVIVEINNKIYNRIHEGMATEIVDGVQRIVEVHDISIKSKVSDVREKVVDVNKVASSSNKYLGWFTIVSGAIGTIVIVSIVVLKLITFIEAFSK